MAVIPARGGSKGIPRKNIKSIAGKPLIAWTIEAARQSSLIDRFVVSTEDAEIAGVALAYGAEVLDRPTEYASDDAATVDVLRHAVKMIPCNTVVLLQATSPVRSSSLIDECIREFSEGGYDSLATGFICKYIEYAKNTLRRQDIQGFFYDDGNVYVIKADLIGGGDRYGTKICRKVIGRRENVDIDDEFDFWIAEKILSEMGQGLINF
ncbi:MAG: acylneuraminate cytidylyltransferase family protein [Nitrospirae bacterium]|nr:acylneuraminate cytidylyltransferase family protein [Nitrospirota bacterium]